MFRHPDSRARVAEALEAGKQHCGAAASCLCGWPCFCDSDLLCICHCFLLPGQTLLLQRYALHPFHPCDLQAGCCCSTTQTR